MLFFSNCDVGFLEQRVVFASIHTDSSCQNLTTHLSTAAQRQTVEYAYVSSKHIRPFAFAEQL